MAEHRCALPKPPESTVALCTHCGSALLVKGEPPRGGDLISLSALLEKIQRVEAEHDALADAHAALEKRVERLEKAGVRVHCGPPMPSALPSSVMHAVTKGTA